jgi:hypothetical protein
MQQNRSLVSANTSGMSLLDIRIHEYFLRLLTDPPQALEVPFKRIQALSRSLGMSDQPLEPIHRDLVLAAIQEARSDDYSNHFRDWIHNLLVFQGQTWVTDAAQLCYARRVGLIDFLPCLSSEEICDQSDGDALLKTLALL